MTATKNVNGEQVELTPEEAAKWLAEQPTQDEWSGVLRERAVSGVKAEAGMRITAILPGWKQRNLTARWTELVLIGLMRLAEHVNFELFTESEMAEIAGGQEAWDQIKAVRKKSDLLEKAVPEDFEADKHWPKR